MNGYTLGALLAAGMFSDCGDGVSSEWQRFNHPNDLIEVVVSPDFDGVEAARADLTSSTGETIVGQVRISPGGGPVGTEHRVVVQVGATWERRVGRVDLRIESGARGTRTLPMERDSASAGTWVTDLRSYGQTGESRVDTFVVRLFELVEVIDVEEPDDF